MVKTGKKLKQDELEKIKNLLILQLANSDIPILAIAKAAGLSPNELYKIIPKKQKKSK